MSGALSIRNRQRAVPVNGRQLRRVATCLLRNLKGAKHYDLGIYLMRPAEMERINETFLRHAGVTDVITFDYGNGSTLHGEILICPDEAVSQARRFRTNWQSELARYVIHGVLHLTGYDDRRPVERRRMKLEENRLLRELGRCCALSELAHPVQGVINSAGVRERGYVRRGPAAATREEQSTREKSQGVET